VEDGDYDWPMLNFYPARSISKDTHTEVFRAIEAIASEFPDGWSVYLLLCNDKRTLDIRLKAAPLCHLTAECRGFLFAEYQQDENVRKVLRRFRADIEQRPNQLTLELTVAN
jgi:hypothetical protein